MVPIPLYVFIGSGKLKEEGSKPATIRDRIKPFLCIIHVFRGAFNGFRRRGCFLVSAGRMGKDLRQLTVELKILIVRNVFAPFLRDFWIQRTVETIVDLTQVEIL